MANGWTAERRAKQGRAIKQSRPVDTIGSLTRCLNRSFANLQHRRVRCASSALSNARDVRAGTFRRAVVACWAITGGFCRQIGFTAFAQLRLPQVAEAFSRSPRKWACTSNTTRAYLMPTTIESGPMSGSTRVAEKPASVIHARQSAPV